MPARGERGEIPAMRESDSKKVERIVPVPMQVPGDKYGDKKPWFFTEQ